MAQLDRAGAGDAVTLTLADEIDIARGDLLADPRDPPEFVDQFAAHIIWMSEHRMVPGRSYLLKIGARTVPATITALKHRVDVDTLAHLADKSLGLNDIGFCNLSTAAPVAFDPYTENRDTGAFILIDRLTNETAGAGMISFGSASGQQHPLAGTDSRTRGAGGSEGPGAGGVVADGVVGSRQVDDCRSRRKAAARQPGATRCCSTATMSDMA